MSLPYVALWLFASRVDWNPHTQTGVVYHRLRSHQPQGRIDVTAIGDMPEQPHEIHLRVAQILAELRPTDQRATG